MLALLLALTASGGYGTADFFGGRASMRFAPVLVVLYVQIAQAIAVAAVILSTGQTFDAGVVGRGAAAGAFNAVGLMLSYKALAKALATGQAGIVAPIVASSSVMPVVFVFARGDAPGLLTLAGLFAVLLGIIISAAAASNDKNLTTPTASEPAAETSVGVRLLLPPSFITIALASALAFGFFFVSLDRASASAGGGLLWVTLGVQLGTIPVAFAAALVQKTATLLDFKILASAPLWFVVVFNLCGDLALTYAMSLGNLAVVSVLASMGPIVTGMLARVLLGERLTRWQICGAGLTVIGTMAVAAAR